MAQVVTIGVDGTVSGLQVKPGKGFDFRKLGRAEIVRASEIVFDEDAQQWKVCVLDGPAAGQTLTAGHLWDADIDTFAIEGLSVPESSESFLLFDSYDDAVKCEIRFLDALRLQGRYT